MLWYWYCGMRSHATPKKGTFKVKIQNTVFDVDLFIDGHK